MQADSEQVQRVLDLLDTGVVRLDAAGGIRFMNSAAENCLLVSRDRACGRRLAEVSPIPAELARAMENVTEPGYSIRLHELRLAGELYDCTVQRTRNRDLMLEFHNLQWEQMRLRLQQREVQTGMLNLLSRNLGHEVRNPLGGIELFSGLLRDELQQAGDEEKLEHVGRIERELGHLKKVVADFLDYARRSKPTLARVDLSALVGDLGELMAGDAAARSIELVAERGDPVWASCDIDQIRRVLLNLTRNAIQATDPEGRVTLSCAGDARRTSLTVQDTGRGMAPETLEQIFKPFYTTREQGTGLGLAFVKKIIDEHGGTLEVESTPGEGTVFRVTLPAAGEA